MTTNAASAGQGARPTPNEIDNVLIWCFEAIDNGSHFPGMTYEDGVEAAIRWLQGEGPSPEADE